MKSIMADLGHFSSFFKKKWTHCAPREVAVGNARFHNRFETWHGVHNYPGLEFKKIKFAGNSKIFKIFQKALKFFKKPQMS